MYVCPFCGLSEFESKKDIITCKKCKRKIRYLPTKELEGVDFEFPFHFVTDWYAEQCKFINNLDVTPYVDEPIYKDSVRYFEVMLYKNKRLVCKNAHIAVYGDRFVLTMNGRDKVMPFENVSVATVLGRNKLNIYADGNVLQFKGDKHFNALKYVNLYYRSKNINQGGENDEFLGI